MTKKKKNKKKLIIILGIVGAFILVMVATFVILLSPAGKSNESMTFNIKSGDGKEKIVEDLKDAGLIKSKYATLLYVILANKKNFQAGSYELSRDMSTQEIINAFNSGKIKDTKKSSISVTFKEGLTVKQYLKIISENTDLEYNNIIKEINDKSFIKGLIADYWFLTDELLNDDLYYPLEGYLYPNTYQIYKDSSLNAIVRKMLDETNKKLTPYKDAIEKSSYSVHDLITIASITEKEANASSDRKMVAQVIYTRLSKNMSLGMDVTSYYGVQKDMSETITSADLADKNPYNTRVVTFIGLPVGPICNPSIDSVLAALDPADTDYVYFVADIVTGKVYFAKSKEEFIKLKEKYLG